MPALQSMLDTVRGYGFLSRCELAGLVRRPGRNDAPARRHALLLAPFLPPYDNGGVHRPLSWLQYAQANGWDIAAVTRAPRGEPSPLGRYLLARMPEDVEVSTMHELPLRPSWSLFPRTDGTFLGALGSIPLAKRIVRARGTSVVVATGPSFDLFITAFYVARACNVRLVLDYRDEWTENPFGVVQRGNSDLFWERRCLRAADRVIFTTEGMMAHCDACFPGVLQGKGMVVRNGWEPRDLDTQAGGSTRARAQVRILFAGTMGHATLPGEFLQDLGTVLDTAGEWRERVRIEIIGTRAPIAEEQLARFPYASALSVQGNYPKDVANAMIRDADALLLLMPRGMERYIPGKLFEYLASGKPIIAHGTPCEGADLVTRLGAGMFVRSGDAAALRRALEELGQSDSRRWDTPERRQWSDAHTREALARQFFGVLDAVIAQGEARAPVSR